MTLISCSPLQSTYSVSNKTIVKNVPFYPDDRYRCGPASLAGVMNYWGQDKSVEEIANKIYSPNAKGTLPIDLKWYAEENNLHASVLEGGIERIKRAIDNKKPIIAFVERNGFFGNYPHFLVVVGYADTGLIVNSGLQEHQLLDYDSFDRMWKNTGRWSLLVEKKQ